MGAGARWPTWQSPAPAGVLVPHMSWGDRLSIGLAATAAAAVEEAGQVRHERAGAPNPDTPWERARRWFVSSFPLLAALADFTVVSERELAQRLQISVAAVDAGVAEIYINPLAGLTEAGVAVRAAHEMLHAALRHGDRVGGRDAYLWNVAADYVINGWLIEMGVRSARRAAARPGASGAVGRGGLRPDRPRPAPAAPPRHAARAGLGDILADPCGLGPATRSAWTSSTAGR